MTYRLYIPDTGELVGEYKTAMEAYQDMRDGIEYELCEENDSTQNDQK